MPAACPAPTAGRYDDFEAWLLHQCVTAGPLTGATRAMAMDILDE